ncbi:hypothetical protein BB560_002762 [Smittium megazygosporum]|uniref:Ferrochelatase n=1 Tax=Smittium megazygosporum TaxID=133381 RepID=A0A2T9ZDZ4_9FUNG|nr:hypothetical protein BB560_002762 [Smittium megazygosporum]
MLNMGGPRNASEVNSYLKGIFLDRDIMRLPFQDTLGNFIANKRTSKVQHEYELIGGGSPLEKFSLIQGQKLVENLDSISPETGPHKAYLGFRYNEPTTKTAIQQIIKDDVKNVIAFSQYPQYSCSTSGSSFNDLYKLQKQLDPKQSIKWSFIDRWGTDPLFVKYYSDAIQKSLGKLDPSVRDSVPILFSAHSVPLYVVLKGDSYANEVGASVGCVMRELRDRGVVNPYKLIWQSQVGPLKWLGPATDEVIKKYGKEGVYKDLVVVPIAFTSDHIETLYELGIEYRDLANSVGIKNFVVVEPPNGNETFTNCITNIVHKQMQNSKRMNYQILSRCFDCDSEQCGITKNWIKAQLSSLL